MNCPTAHNEARKGDFAKTVLMPGDPLRSRRIAEEFLEGARLVNNVRGVQGYTGTWRGKEISVMASGMGMPAIGIYSYELFAAYDVDQIIRVGTCGALQEEIGLRSLVLGAGASTDSAFGAQFRLPGNFSALADFSLLQKAAEIAEREKMPFHVGNLLSTDVFYSDSPTSLEPWKKMGILAVEMEAAALYQTAARLGKRALAICTVSNHLITGEETDAAERQNAFDDMIRLALEVGISD